MLSRQDTKALIFDFDGVFTLDNYDAVVNAFQKSSGLPASEIIDEIGRQERKYVLATSSKQFLADLRDIFKFQWSPADIADLLNQRGDSGLFDEMPKIKATGLSLSICSNQLDYRVPHVRRELEARFGLENFDRVWFSPEVGFVKPYVGFTQDVKSIMDVSGVDIFQHVVVPQMAYLGYNPENCVFIDDSVANIEGARKHGLNGIIFENVQQMKRALKEGYGISIE